MHGLERLAERLGQRDHLRPALLEFFGAHGDAHELECAAEIFFCIFQVHAIDEHAGAGALQEGQSGLLHQPGVDLALTQRFHQIDAHGGEPHLRGIGTGLFE